MGSCIASGSLPLGGFGPVPLGGSLDGWTGSTSRRHIYYI